MASEKTTATNTSRQNENPYLIMSRIYIVLLVYFRKFVPEIIPLLLKNWNQCIDTGGLKCRGATQVFKKTWAYS